MVKELESIDLRDDNFHTFQVMQNIIFKSINK